MGHHHKKSGSPPKRRKPPRPSNPREALLREHAKRMRDNAGLLLRVVAYLVQHSPQIAAHFNEKGDARIPLEALGTDVDVGIAVEEGYLVIAPAPLPPADEEAPLTVEMVIDLLGLASVYATREQVEAWSDEQREAAADWGAHEHARAAVEEPPYPEKMPVPAHVAELPIVLGIDPPQRPGGPWTTWIRHPDGREEHIEKMPGEVA